MNSRAIEKLNSYMFGIGDVHQSINLLKRALRFDSRIPTDDIEINNLFDKNTQIAVALFQKGKELTLTGRMDFMTWLALGSELNPMQIKGLFASDVTLQNLLGLGYVFRHPYRNTVSNNFLNNAVIHTNSSGLAAQPNGFNFTFRVFVTVFAPFDWFGPFNLSKGDGADRRFGIKQAASYRLQCSSTITAASGDKTYYWTELRKAAVTTVSNPTTSVLRVPFTLIPLSGGMTVLPVPYPKVAKSAGHLKPEEKLSDFDLLESDEIKNSPDRLKYHFFGNDAALSFWGNRSWIAADIDVHPTINFDYKQDKDNPKKVTMRVYGNIIGDQFPAVETFILDKNGNGVMLGVWQARKDDGPVFTANGRFGIEGDKQLPMIDIDVTVIVEDGVFTGVLKNEKVVSLAEHNQYYTNLPTIKLRYSATDPKPAPLPTPTPRR